MKKIVASVFMVFTIINGYSQFSKTHYIPPLTSATSMRPSQQYLYISTPTLTNVNVIITPIGGVAFTATVNSSTPYVYKIPDAVPTNTQLFTPQANIGKLTNKGYVIEADDLIYANVRTMAGSTSHAGCLVAKGKSAMGKIFRIGGMLNKYNPLGNNWDALLNFASFMATENDTHITITLSDPLAIGTPMTNGTNYSGPITVTLNKYESYVMAFENVSAAFRSSYILGGLIQSDKDIVVNAGSFGGNSYTPGVTGDLGTPSNNNVSGGASSTGDFKGKDLGFDQIVPYEKTGKEYIFVKGLGSNALERVLIIAHVDNTQIFKNGSTTATTTLNAGQYYVYDGSDFTAGNLYVTSSEKVFAYQAIGGNTNLGNQNMFFVPPINCATPNIVDNIPLINEIGPNNSFSGNINIVTEFGSLVRVNNVTVTSSPVTVAGTTTPRFVRYTVTGRTGNIKVSSTKQVYVSYFGSDANATYGGYYSGFDTKPEISYNSPVVGASLCIPNIVLKIPSAVATDLFQWQFNSVDIPGETANIYTPKSVALGGRGPGYYSVSKTITGCSNTTSDLFPVSDCPIDTDNDAVNNNIDIDNDNDGITNANESYGNQNINVSVSTGSLTIGNYNNSYTSTTTPIGTGNTFTGNANGSFTTSLVAGNTNAISQTLNFTTPVTLGLTCNPLVGATVASLSNEAFVVKSDMDKTITITNPTNQLLIDTDYDGIYETGITKFSSFDVRFVLNPAVLLPATGTPPAIDFKIQTYLSNSISFAHRNLSTTQTSTASFSFYADSLSKDSDADGTTDQLDNDSDNDGILDIVEGQIGNKVITNVDLNKNGLDDTFEPIVAPIDSDVDGVLDYADLDSDNDGILDSVETAIDTDADLTKNFRDKDSDGDTCNDVVEAGFTDGNADGILGNSPTTVDANGKVTSGTNGYTTPAGSPTAYYLITAMPVITAQPTATTNCVAQTADITMTENGGNIIKWQVSTDNGTTWTDVSNNTTYSGATTNTLHITGVTSGYKYRTVLTRNESACSPVQSNVVTVILTGSPVVVDVVMKQCDADVDGKSTFDLTSYNTQISTNSVNETFSYYTSQTGASTANPAELISNPTTYSNTTPYLMDVWARVINSAGCPSTAKITLNVYVTLPSTYTLPTQPAPICDDNRDGIATFDLTATKTAIEALFPSIGYTVVFYRNQADAIAQTNAITTISNYSNIGYPTTQDIWVRVNSGLSTCYSLGKYFTINVEALPIANPVIIARQCDDNQDGKFTFNTATLESTLLNGQLNKIITYFDASNNPLRDANNVLITSPFPATFTTTSQTIKAVVANNTAQSCSDFTSIIFNVDPSPVVINTVMTICDTDLDGKATFDLTANNSQISANAANEVFTYYKSQTGASTQNFAEEITTPTAFINTTIHTMDVWARVVSINGCSNLAKVTLNVVVAFPSTYIVPTTPICDDNRDGIATFNLTGTKTTIESLLPSSGYSVSYYRNQADALVPINAITDLTNYSNIGFPNTQQIWVRVDNTLSAACFSLGSYITLNVEALPTANPVLINRECDDNQDGKFTFNTTNLEATVLNGQTNATVTVTYFDGNNNPLRDANGVAINSPFPSSFTTTSQTIKAVVINNTPQRCSDQTLIMFTVDVKPMANPVGPFIVCDNEVDPLLQDGKFAFNTSAFDSILLGSQTGMTVKYYDENGILLPSPLRNPFLTRTQTIKAVVENPLNTNCIAQEFIVFKVNPLPKINLNSNGFEDEVICSNTPSMSVNLNAGIQDGSLTSNYTYQWSKNGNDLIGENSYNLNNVNSIGIYRVVVTNSSGCNRTRTIKVVASDIAHIDSIIVTDLTENNTITVNLVAGGTGDYEFSIDEHLGYFQNSNVFYDVSPGIHTVYIRDKNGCGPDVTTVVNVMGFPKFFTPNNDGYNDYWGIKGVDSSIGYILYVYDRYGKLIKNIVPGNQGWDGNYDGNPMPGSDYWYNIKLDNGREAKGHFSLKR